jgi:hypothetical protein
MKRLLILLALLASPVLAHAEGGTPTNPLYVREQQGTTRTYAEVDCTTAGDIALVAAASTANARSILFTNEDASNFVTICPVTAAAGVCDAVGEGFTLWNKGSIPFDRSVRDTGWSCKGDTGTVKVGVLIEK